MNGVRNVRGAQLVNAKSAWGNMFFLGQLAKVAARMPFKMWIKFAKNAQKLGIAKYVLAY